MDEVPAVLRGTLKHPKPEPLLEGAAERIHAAVRELKELGIVDEKGNRVRTDLPEDMKEGAERDFGGQVRPSTCGPGCIELPVAGERRSGQRRFSVAPLFPLKVLGKEIADQSL